MTLFGPWQPIDVPNPPFSLTTTSLFNISRIWSLLDGAWRLLYCLTASSGNFSIRFQSTDGPSSCRNLPNKDEKLFISSLNVSFLSSGAVWIKLSSSRCSWRRASRLVVSWNSLASLGTRECVRFCWRRKKIVYTDSLRSKSRTSAWFYIVISKILKLLNSRRLRLANDAKYRHIQHHR